MSAKDTLCQMLKTLGFEATVTEQNYEDMLLLDIQTDEPNRLIGRQGQTLGEIQYLLNRLIQAEDPKAPRVTVDVEHRRAMRNDRLVEKMRAIADLVKERGKPLQTEPLNAYDRWLVHQAFKDDPEIQSWSPDDHARMKRITLRLRKKENA
jgi:spoIIIJ-associated protein